MKKALLVLGLLAVLLAGCGEKKPDTGTPATQAPSQPPAVQPPEEKKDFRFGEELAIKKGSGPYVNAEAGISLSVASFSDSRCKEGKQCVWQGEQGVRVKASDANNTAEVFLGESTNKKDNFLLYYSAELVSIDASAGTAVVKVTKREQAGAWFFTEPKQCGTNEWESGASGGVDESDKEKLGTWLRAKGIEVQGFAQKKVHEVVCAACTCPRGDRVAVLVGQNDAAKMKALNWEALNGTGIVFCTEEAKICQDGSTVGRQAPFCDFAECTKRTFYIKKVDVPGFVPEPVFVTTVIDSNRAVIVETKDSGGKATIRNTIATAKQLDELKALVEATDFFALGPKDMKTCVIDAPTVDLTVVSGDKSNSLFGIGAWCDPNKLKGMDKVMEKISEISGE